MATHSSVLAWRIPGTGEPGGLPSLGLHRVGHDRSNSAAAAEASFSLDYKHCLLIHVQILETLTRRAKHPQHNRPNVPHMCISFPQEKSMVPSSMFSHHSFLDLTQSYKIILLRYNLHTTKHTNLKCIA